VTRVPLVVLSSIDPVLREAAVFGLAVDSAGTTVLRYDISEDPGELRRTVIVQGEVVEDLRAPLAHACASCAIREDAIPVMASLVDRGKCDSLVLALPVTAESHGVSRTLARATASPGPLCQVRLASVGALVDVTTFEEDLLGKDRVCDRGLGFGQDDERPIAGALVEQVSHADVLLVHGHAPTSPRASDLLDHVRAADGVRMASIHETDLRTLLRLSHDSERADARMDPVFARPHGGSMDQGAWTIEVATPHALHPQRLVNSVESLAIPGVRSFGAFWTPTRPFTVCTWDAAGGQLYIGERGTWGRIPPRSRLVITGVGDGREALMETFRLVSLSSQETERGLGEWLGAPDPLDSWLGAREIHSAPGDGAA